MKILAIGPYIGDFENEIIEFRPYVRWLMEVVEWDNVYLSTHINRSFLYDFIPEENIIPIYHHLSRDEKSQYKNIHKHINKKDFNLIIKDFKDKIIEKEKCNRKDIELYHLIYSKNSQKGVYEKIFSGINKIEDIVIPKSYENKIIFIPSKKEKRDKSSYIYNWLLSCYTSEVIIIGDSNTWFKCDNTILNRIEYSDLGYKYIFKCIEEANCIITPLSHWTIICNLMNKKVFSWGESPGQFRYGGIYNFDNRKCNIIPSDNKTNPEVIVKCIKRFLE